MNVKGDIKTQRQAVLEHLRKYKTITQLEAVKYYGAYRLSDIIFNFRKKGFGIETEDATGRTRYGTTTNYAIYHLVSEPKEGTK